MMLKSDIDEDSVLLQVMKIPRLDERNECESVLWDTACSGMFVMWYERSSFPNRGSKGSYHKGMIVWGLTFQILYTYAWKVEHTPWGKLTGEFGILTQGPK